jgi:hypothetical protein
MLGTWTITIGGVSFATFNDIVDVGDASGGPRITAFPGYGAPAPVYVNLGNTEIKRTVTMTREHPSDTAAEAWRQTAIATFAGVATVQMTHLDYEGNQAEFSYENAKIEVAVPQRIGLTTITKLTINSGT